MRKVRIIDDTELGIFNNSDITELYSLDEIENMEDVPEQEKTYCRESIKKFSKTIGFINTYRDDGYDFFWVNDDEVEFVAEEAEFTLDSLVTGMIVEFRDGRRCLVINGDLDTLNYGKQKIIFVDEKTFYTTMNYYNLDLTNKINNNSDVMKVYKCNITGINYMLKSVADKDLIWERKENKVDWSKV